MAVFPATGGVMAGCEHRFKTEDSLFRKLTRRLDHELKNNGATLSHMHVLIAQFPRCVLCINLRSTCQCQCVAVFSPHSLNPRRGHSLLCAITVHDHEGSRRCVALHDCIAARQLHSGGEVRHRWADWRGSMQRRRCAGRRRDRDGCLHDELLV
jgi:hypothetical protein